jgi:hypothetical protein
LLEEKRGKGVLGFEDDVATPGTAMALKKKCSEDWKEKCLATLMAEEDVGEQTDVSVSLGR